MELKNIKLWISDFDGVFTNNKVWISESGEEMVQVSRADGMAVQILKSKGIKVIVISSEKNKVVERRCKKLQISFFCGVHDKKEVVKNIISKENIEYRDVLYIGNDINDFAALQMVGIKVAPKDAEQSIKNIADIVLDVQGGEGVLRKLVFEIWKI